MSLELLKKALMKDYVSATSTLNSFENHWLKTASEEERKFVKERIEYWSAATIQLKQDLMELYSKLHSTGEVVEPKAPEQV